MSDMKPSSPRVIAVLNQKGGVGKTTSTVNLGAALAEAGQRVCLIDLDPQAHLTLHLGIDPGKVRKTVYDLLIDPDSKATEAIINARPNLDAILSEVDLAAAETELASTPDRQSILRRKFLVPKVASKYDIVIIDCPPSLGLLTLNALSLAQEVFVPMQAHFLALQGVGKLLETVGLVCQSINPQLRVSGIILCMHEQQTTLAKEIVADLDSFFAEAASQDVPWKNCRVLRPAIRRNVKLAEAPSFGKTIFDYEPTCPGAADYRALAEQVLQGSGQRSAVSEQKTEVSGQKSEVRDQKSEISGEKLDEHSESKPLRSEAPPQSTSQSKPGQSEATPRVNAPAPQSPAVVPDFKVVPSPAPLATPAATSAAAVETKPSPKRETKPHSAAPASKPAAPRANKKSAPASVIEPRAADAVA